MGTNLGTEAYMCVDTKCDANCEDRCVHNNENPVITYQVASRAHGQVKLQDDMYEYDTQSHSADFFGRLLTKKDVPPALSERKPFEVRLTRGEQNVLGLIVTPDVDPGFLVIDDIFKPSVASEWNDTHDESLRLRVGDTITSVNGVTSNSQEMLSTIRSTPTTAEVRLIIEDAPSAAGSSPDPFAQCVQAAREDNPDDGLSCRSRELLDVLRNKPEEHLFGPRCTPAGNTGDNEDVPSWPFMQVPAASKHSPKENSETPRWGETDEGVAEDKAVTFSA